MTYFKRNVKAVVLRNAREAHYYLQAISSEQPISNGLFAANTTREAA